MSAQTFSQLFRERRAGTTNPNTSRSFTVSEMASQLELQTGDPGWRERLEGWESGAPLPADQQDWLVTVCGFLALYGGLGSPEEIVGMFEAAGYAPPNDSVIQQIYASAGSGVVSTNVDRSGAASIGESRLQRQTAQRKAGGSGSISFEPNAPPDIPIQQQQENIPPEPSAPKPEEPMQVAELDYNGLHIVVAHTEHGWRLPGIEALVTPRPGSVFFSALLSELEPGISTRLDKLVRRQIASRPPVFDSPTDIPLPEDLAPNVLPSAAAGRGRLIVGTRRGRNGKPNPNYVEPLMRSLTELAGEKEIRHLAMPILGAGGSQEDPALVLGRMLDFLFRETNYGGLQSITFLTIAPHGVDAARRRFNRYTNNQAQALSNDQPGGVDLLGIAPEINALADTLALREVKPPMAVGVTGGWGSGKSFVMHLIQQRLIRIRTRPLKQVLPGDPDGGSAPAFAGHIYQIRFNAWTYAKSNLWASLMQTVFFELNRQMTLEQIFAHETPQLSGGDIYTRLYEEGYEPPEELLKKASPEVRASNLLWGTMRKRKQKQLDELHKIEKKVADAKVERDKALKARQEDVTKELGTQAQQAAISVLQKKVMAVVGEVFRDTSRKKRRVERPRDGAPTADAQAGAAAKSGGETAEIEGVEAAADIEELIATLRSTGATLSNLLGTARKGWPYVVLLLVFTLAAVAAIRWFIRLDDVQRTLAWLASLIPLALAILRVLRNWGKRVDEIVSEYQSTLESERANYEKLRDERLAQKQAEDEKVVAEVMVKEKTASTPGPQNKPETVEELARSPSRVNLVAHERVLQKLEAQAEEQRRQVGPTSRYVSLLDFVSSRLDEASYEGQLGLMHQVKADLDELTASLTPNEWDTADEQAEKQRLFPRGEPRVILFIDDLDRCPPSRVVEVMEAVQLLLNTELFVVVLGLDTRYVTRALEKEYKEILQHEGDPSGLDYIEKIIQIPYRVRPIELAGLGKYLEAQMQIAAEPARDVRPVPASEVAIAGIPPAPGQAVKSVSSAVKLPPTPPVAVRDVELPPEVIKFQPDDYSDLVYCCDLTDLTPRSVKRLVNVLKLIKIFWFRSAGHDQLRPVKQSAMALLALSAAYPEVMREAFLELDAKFRDTHIARTRVLDQLSALQLRPALESALKWQIDRYRADVKSLKTNGFGNVTLNTLTLSTFNLVRSFSFVGDPSYGADNPEEAENGKAVAPLQTPRRPKKKARQRANRKP